MFASRRTPAGDERYYGGSEMDRPYAGSSTWGSRVSWAAIFAGVFVAIATQLTFAALGAWIGLGLSNVAAIEGLGDISTEAGLWLMVVGLLGLFAGAFVASWLAGSRTFMNGLWHGVSVWALTLVLSVWLSVSGVAGILGFGLMPRALFEYLPGVDPGATAVAAADLSATFAGWFVLGALVSLATAVVGGWLGTYNRGRLAEPAVTMEEEPERRAA